MNDTDVETSKTKEPSDSTIFSLLHAAHTLEDKVEAALDKVGLSLPKYSVLNELVSADKALSLSELATRLSCVPCPSPRRKTALRSKMPIQQAAPAPPQNTEASCRLNSFAL